jgi:GNAT superfamily N-acetyltransferase
MSMGEPFAIRVAMDADHAMLAQLGAELFEEAFGTLYRPSDLASHLAASYTPEVIARARSRGDEYWIVESGAPLAFAKVGALALPVDVSPPHAVELKQLYARRAWHGSGVGQMLMDRAVAWAQRKQASELFVGCWSQNPRALRFYERNGFQRVGQYLYPVGQQLDLEWILRRPIAAG